MAATCGVTRRLGTCATLSPCSSGARSRPWARADSCNVSARIWTQLHHYQAATLPAQPSHPTLLLRSRRTALSRRVAALPPLAMVNVDFASPSLVLGAALIGCGVLLLQLRSLQNQVSRDADIVVAAMVSIVGSTLIFQGWRLDPLLLLCQALTTSVAFWYGLEAFRLRGKEAQQQQQQQQALPPPDANATSYLGQQGQAQGQDPAMRGSGMGGMMGGFYDPQQTPQYGSYPEPLQQQGQWGAGNANSSGMYPWPQQQQPFQGSSFDPSPSPRWGLPPPASTSGGRPFGEAITLDYYGNPMPQEEWAGGYADTSAQAGQYGAPGGFAEGQYASTPEGPSEAAGGYQASGPSGVAGGYPLGGSSERGMYASEGGAASTSGSSGNGSNNGAGFTAQGLAYGGYGGPQASQGYPGTFDSDGMAADTGVASAAPAGQLQWEQQRQQQQGAYSAGAPTTLTGPSEQEAAGQGLPEQQAYWALPEVQTPGDVYGARPAGGEGPTLRGGRGAGPAEATKGGKAAAAMFEPVDDWE